MFKGRLVRWCQQCCTFQAVEEFDGDRRTCRKRLAIHNSRRKKQRQNLKDEGLTTSKSVDDPDMDEEEHIVEKVCRKSARRVNKPQPSNASALPASAIIPLHTADIASGSSMIKPEQYISQTINIHPFIPPPPTAAVPLSHLAPMQVTHHHPPPPVPPRPFPTRQQSMPLPTVTTTVGSTQAPPLPIWDGEAVILRLAHDLGVLPDIPGAVSCSDNTNVLPRDAPGYLHSHGDHQFERLITSMCSDPLNGLHSVPHSLSPLSSLDRLLETLLSNPSELTAHLAQELKNIETQHPQVVPSHTLRAMSLPTGIIDNVGQVSGPPAVSYSENHGVYIPHRRAYM